MYRRPVITTEPPTYPKGRRGGALRRTAAVALTGAALWLGGCGDILPFDNTRVGGEPMPVSAFACDDQLPASMPELSYPGYYEVELCGEDTAWAAVEVTETTTLRFSFFGTPSNTLLDIISPEDELLGQITVLDTSVDLELQPGTHLLAATKEDPSIDDDWEWLTLQIETVGPTL